MYLNKELHNINKAIKRHERLFFKARIYTLLTEVSLRYIGLKMTERILSLFKKKRKAPNRNKTIEILDFYATIFNKMNQQSYLKGRCLSQSLIMRLLLNHAGISSELKIGVSHLTGKFDAHAWLEKDNLILNDHPSKIADYFPLPQHKINSILKIR